MVNIYVFINSKSIADRIESIIGGRHEYINLEFFDNMDKFMWYYSEARDADILIIELPEDESDAVYDMATRFKNFNIHTLTIFVGTKEQCIKAVNAEPFRYVDRDEMENKLTEYLDYAMSRVILQHREMFTYKKNRSELSAPLNYILYFYTELRKVFFGYESFDGKYYIEEFYGKLEDVIQQIETRPNSFVRVSKGGYINKRYIRFVRGEKLIMADGATITMDKKYYRYFG